MRHEELLQEGLCTEGWKQSVLTVIQHNRVWYRKRKVYSVLGWLQQHDYEACK